jgi:hypothetical protein
METSYVLFYDHPETDGKQVVWDGDTGTGAPKYYNSVQDCFMDFVGLESSWGRSLYAVPPQIREVTRAPESNEFTETGQLWFIDITELGYQAIPVI